MNGVGRWAEGGEGATMRPVGDGIERVAVAGFGSLRVVELEPGRLTVLIGANGSGKSNVLRALGMVPLMRAGSLRTFVAEAGGASMVLHYGPSRTQALTFELDFVRGGGRSRYAVRLGFAAGDRLVYLDESVGWQPPGAGAMVTRSLGTGHAESVLGDAVGGNEAARRVDEWLARLNFLHVHDTSRTSPMRLNANASDDRFLRSNGSNLAAYLWRLANSSVEDEQTAWRRIGQLVRRVAPSVKELCPTRTTNGSDFVRLDWVDDQDARFGVSQLSDGTLRAIALVTLLAQPTGQLPRLICIDEPELGLHPAAISLLAELARSISRHTQVVFATQSPALLDHFEPDEVVVVEREGGATVLRRLEPDALKGWLEDYSLAEVFEKGIIGGRP